MGCRRCAKALHSLFHTLMWMSQTGNHGGSTEGETSAASALFQPLALDQLKLPHDSGSPLRFTKLPSSVTTSTFVHLGQPLPPAPSRQPNRSRPNTLRSDGYRHPKVSLLHSRADLDQTESVSQELDGPTHRARTRAMVPRRCARCVALLFVFSLMNAEIMI